MNIQHVHISGSIICECKFYFTVYNGVSIQLYSQVHQKMKNSVISCSPTCRWHVGWVLLFTKHFTNQLELVRPFLLGCMLTLFGFQKFVNNIFSNQFGNLWASENLCVLLLSFKNVLRTTTFHRHGDFHFRVNLPFNQPTVEIPTQTKINIFIMLKIHLFLLMCLSHYYFYKIPTVSAHVALCPKQDLIGT